ncbi:rhodanese domain protein (plasmid) [Peptoclostridium acidaminophilum DSM 3953]|uniref:Rhodanese domain protein n=1 Tax=Peptoclostridium acidaminophilum DSM 3953 TaxID=1286171 RepID=W8T8L8_PEPAC|nr:hypothetical protein [Peptoclostridium acidaminophilum]AHM58044.1 rhodanese domain protein [Peptoclostridium acidaminophilum DSM 3953]
MKKKHILLVVSLFLMAFLAVGCSSAPTETKPEAETKPAAEAAQIPKELGEYNYISAADLKARIDAGDLESGAMIMTSSQTEEELADSYMKGDLIKTQARPLETVEDYAKLEPVYEIIKDTDADVILICPGGKSGATRPADYFAAKGIDTDRLLILEGGQGNFSKLYPDYVVFGDKK